MQKLKLLLVEDEPDIADIIKLQAEIAGYKLVVETDGLNGWRAIEREKPDLVILDLMLPGQSGFEICKKIKNHPDLKTTPVIILSAKSEEIDQLLGLEIGADDYMTKPFSPKVLFSKIKVILKRGQESEKGPKTLAFGPFTLELDSYVLRKKDKEYPITLSEFNILKRLITARGKVLSRNQLLDDLQGGEAYVVDRNIDVHIAALRKKLGPNFDWIETVRGVGYRFRDED